jgi:glutamate racemase
MKNVLLMVILVALLTGFWFSSGAQNGYDPKLLFNKEEITIVITDSGLGGLAVMDEVAKKMTTSRSFKKVNLIFVNALFDSSTGYNALNGSESKINIFSSVLTSINQNYHPDMILVACNTLSVLYKETPFVKKSKTPVFGIVEPGVDLIAESLSRDTTSTVILFGTETTIEEGSHRRALLSRHFDGKRIVVKACPQLQSYIEQNPKGEETGMLISAYLNEALEQLAGTSGAVYLSLNCSHFGYSEDLWKSAFSETPFKFGAVLDPNHRMGDFLADPKYSNRYPETALSFKVVSKVELLNEKSMFNIFEVKSPGLAKALHNYQLLPGLFKVSSPPH